MSTSTSPVDIRADHLEIVQDILRTQLPAGVKVWVFGSRANWTTKDSSDLDLAVEGAASLDHGVMVGLEIAFEESDLPYTVDVVDLHVVNDAFKEIVESQRVPLPMAGSSGNEWREVALSDIGTIDRGRSRHRPRNAPELYGGPYPFIQTGDIKSSGGRIVSHTQTYSELGLSQSRLWPAGTMAITIAANIAETAILTYPACFPDSVVGFIGDQSKCDTRFVEYNFRQLRNKIQHENVGTGSVQDNINLQTLGDLRFPLRPLSEQRAIAHILGTLDDKIELNRRMNQTLEEMARAIFQDWFVDFGPVRAKLEGREPYLPVDLWSLFPDRFVDSELGEIPKGWEATALGELGSLNPESWSRVYHPDEVEYVDLANTKWGVIESTQHFPWKDAPSRAKRVMHSGDTIVGTVRPGNGSYALVGTEGLTGSTGFAVLRPSHSRLRELVYLATTAHDNIEWLAHRADGAAYPAVRPEIVAETEVAIPMAETDILDWFSATVGSIFDKMESTKTESRFLAAQRDVLLPKLVSGKLRAGNGVNFG